MFDGLEAEITHLEPFGVRLSVDALPTLCSESYAQEFYRLVQTQGVVHMAGDADLDTYEGFSYFCFESGKTRTLDWQEVRQYGGKPVPPTQIWHKDLALSVAVLLYTPDMISHTEPHTQVVRERDCVFALKESIGGSDWKREAYTSYARETGRPSLDRLSKEEQALLDEPDMSLPPCMQESMLYHFLNGELGGDTSLCIYDHCWGQNDVLAFDNNATFHRRYAPQGVSSNINLYRAPLMP